MTLVINLESVMSLGQRPVIVKRAVIYSKGECYLLKGGWAQKVGGSSAQY